MAKKVSVEDSKSLLTELLDPQVADNPLAFVKFNYEWGKKDTPLEGLRGPRNWQIEELEEIADAVASNRRDMAKGIMPTMYRKSTVSGRGAGKSALLAWLVDWQMSCVLGSTTIVAANNEFQLKNRTWAELGRWRQLALNEHLFDMAAMSMRPAPMFDEAVKRDRKIDTKYYHAIAQLWTEENPNAFAGAHSSYGLQVMFDEAAGIPASIWTVTNGFYTEPTLHRYWQVFSNGRNNSGAFYETHHADKDRWRRRQLDSRTVENIDLKILDDIIAKYGVDSDEARVEVYGQFPDHGDNQFISRGAIRGAMERTILPDRYEPIVAGMDVAPRGKDKNVIRFIQGRDGRSIPPVKWQEKDNMLIAEKAATVFNAIKPDAICIDAGNGTGVIDALRRLGFKVHEVWFGGKSDEPEYGNRRAQLYGRIRDWLPGAMLDNDIDLEKDLAGPMKRRPRDSDKVWLEDKDEMMKRTGQDSPDDADALAACFHVKPARRDMGVSRGARTRVATGMNEGVYS